MTFQKWKHGLDYQMQQCALRDAPEPPPVVLEWFDFNRSFMDVEESLLTDGQRQEAARFMDICDRMREEADRVKASGTPWQFGFVHHTDAYGWRLMLSCYTRDGTRRYVVGTKHQTPPTTGDIKKRDMMLRYIGGDPSKDLLMHMSSDATDDLWTFPVKRNVKITTSASGPGSEVWFPDPKTKERTYYGLWVKARNVDGWDILLAHDAKAEFWRIVCMPNGHAERTKVIGFVEARKHVCLEKFESITQDELERSANV